MKNKYLAIGMAILFGACTPKTKVDLIVHNASIYTVDEHFTMAEAMAIGGDSIVEIGPEHQILNKYSSENTMDVKGQFIYPGFIDAHSHFMGYAKNLEQLNLVGIPSELALIQRVAERVKSSASNWIQGRGWDHTKWEGKTYPSNVWCDSLFPDHYVFLKRIDGHAALVSNNLLKLAGIDENTLIEGGQIVKKDGQLTGILIDNAIDLIESFVPEISDEHLTDLLIQAQQNCFEVGLTSVCDAGLSGEEAELLKTLSQEQKLQLKLYIMLNPSENNFKQYLKSGPYADGQISIRSFKFYCDGALGSRGALLLEPYADVTEHNYHGLFLGDKETFIRRSKDLYQAGFQMNTHAIGDSANRMMLEIYAGVLKGVNDRRWRLEHAQVVNPADLHWFKENTIIPSVQPTHATSDMDWADDRLGSERLPHAYAYKSLKNQNGMIALGTDFPVEKINPLLTLLSGTKRTNQAGQPAEGFLMDESLSFEDCLRGMSIWAAMANFEEHSKGSLESGKKADFVIFNRDLKQLDAENLDEYHVVNTFVNGTKVYARQN